MAETEKPTAEDTEDGAPENRSDTVATEDSSTDNAIEAEEADVIDAPERDVEEPAEITEPPVAPEPIPAAAPDGGSSGGFWGGIVGGVVASVLAFGAYWAIDRADDPVDLGPTTARVDAVSNDLDAQRAALEALQDEVARNADAPAAGEGIEARLGTLETELSERIDALTEQGERMASTLSVLEGRLAQVEARPPVFEGDASEATGELIAQMRSALEAQRAEIENLADEARDRLEAAEAEAAALQENAAATARAATVRAAQSRLMAALDAGGPFAAPLADLAEARGEDLPEALTANAESGVPTLADLRVAFPEAARAALTETSKDALGEDAGAMDRIGAFLKAQTGARSLQPREGDSPDAILSRAEAALADGRVEDALGLIGQLPEAGQDAMADWRAMADTRLAALAAAASLTAD